jgi:hypothetical protein
MQLEELDNLTITGDKQTGLLSITGLPYDVFKSLLTNASLYVYDSEKVNEAKAASPASGEAPDHLKEAALYYRKQHHLLKTLEDKMNVALGFHSVGPPLDDAFLDDLVAKAIEETPARLAKEAALEQKQVGVKAPLGEALGWVRQMVVFCGYVSGTVRGLLFDSQYHQVDFALSQARQIIPMAKSLVASLEAYAQAQEVERQYEQAKEAMKP